MGEGLSSNGNARERAHQAARFWIDNGFAINWTAGKDGDDAKRCVVKGWPETVPLKGELSHVAGQVAARLENRNPVVVLRPSRLIGIECDSEKDAERLATYGLPPTLTARSSERWKLHFYFRAPAENLPYAAFRFESGTLTADAGRYFVTPPALHPSGVSYERLNGTDIAVLPLDLYEKLAGRNGDQAAAAASIPEIIPIGKIDDTLTSLAGTMRRRGAVEEAIYAALVATLPRLQPGHTHTEKDCRRIARSVGRYEPTSSTAKTNQGGEALEIVTLEQFTAVEEAGAEPLVGNAPDDVLIPEGGDIMLYGDGGASKTTLGVDLGLHVAAGDVWLGNQVNQPTSVLLLENEGPRPLFRAKLERKLKAWTGSPLEGRVHVYQGPWGKMSFADPDKRRQLAEAIRDHEIGLLVAGPLTRLGMDEAGTLQQVRDFMDLIGDVRELSGRRVAMLLIHHENKGGKVSGAWEGSGDTLIHAEVHGNGYTKLTFQKARWSSPLHGQDLKLCWTDGEGFEVEETRERDLYADILASLADDLVTKDPEASGQRKGKWSPWKTAAELARLLKANKDTCREVADRLTERGELEYQEGPPGRVKTAHCWGLRSGSEAPSHPEPLRLSELG